MRLAKRRLAVKGNIIVLGNLLFFAPKAVVVLQFICGDVTTLNDER
jgi:hypothetical protein